jgi:hypothetical protein
MLTQQVKIIHQQYQKHGYTLILASKILMAALISSEAGIKYLFFIIRYIGNIPFFKGNLLYFSWHAANIHHQAIDR